MADPTQPAQSHAEKLRKSRERAKVRYAERAALGLCHRCSEPVTSGTACDDCKSDQRERMKRARGAS